MCEEVSRNKVLALLSFCHTHRDLTQSRHRQCRLTPHNNWDPATFWRQSRPQKTPRALSLWWLAQTRTCTLAAGRTYAYIHQAHSSIFSSMHLCVYIQFVIQIWIQNWFWCMSDHEGHFFFFLTTEYSLIGWISQSQEYAEYFTL